MNGKEKKTGRTVRVLHVNSVVPSIFENIDQISAYYGVLTLWRYTNNHDVIVAGYARDAWISFEQDGETNS